MSIERANTPATTPPKSILVQLREGTTDLHESLESGLPLGSMDLNRERYIQVLQGFRGFFASWEPVAQRAAPPALVDFVTHRARTALLDRDLAALSSSPDGAVALNLPDLSTTPRLLGSMYVLEGSRLGGQSLVRGLEARLGLTPQHGLAFFTGFGPQTGSQWKAFCALLEEQVSPVDAPHAVAAARATFLSIHNWMTASGVASPARISGVDTKQ